MGQIIYFYILFKDENNKTKAQSSNDEIMNSMNLDGNKWFYTEYKFKVPINYKNIIDIFFGYKKNTKGERLISDIKLEIIPRIRIIVKYLMI